MGRPRTTLAVMALCVLLSNAPRRVVSQNITNACPEGQNRRTRTLAGAMPFTGVNASSGMRDGLEALFFLPTGLAFSPDGARLAIADTGNHAVRLVGMDGKTTTLAGTGPSEPGFADGRNSSFKNPTGIDFSPNGTVLALADEQNARIRLLDLSLGSSRTLAGGTVGTRDGSGTDAQFNEPAGVAFSPDGGRLVVVDKGNHRVRVIMLSSGETSTLAGSSSAPGFADGQSYQARFKQPCGIAFSPDGASVAVADAGNNAVRVITMPSVSTNTTVWTLAGNGTAGFEDGISAYFSDPRGVSFSPDGNWLAVADHGNNAIRVVNLFSNSTLTVAGRSPFSRQLLNGFFGDGAGPTFYKPTSVAFSPDGRRIAVADRNNHAIRLIELRCMDCPGGTYKDSKGSADCVSCSGESTSRPGSNASSDCMCLQGFFLQNNTCMACARGKFSAIQGATGCEECPAGSFSNMSGASTCLSCGAGFFSDTIAAVGCTMCERGKYSSDNASTTCKLCEIGKASNALSASACEACEPGTYSNVQNATACYKCAAGKYSLQFANNCSDCPFGTNSAEGSGACECDAGFSGPKTGPCAQCEPGKYKATFGSESCLVCPRGKFSGKNASLACSTCPAGATSALGSRGMEDCECDIGFARSPQEARNDTYYTYAPENSSNSTSASATSVVQLVVYFGMSAADFEVVKQWDFKHSVAVAASVMLSRVNIIYTESVNTLRRHLLAGGMKIYMDIVVEETNAAGLVASRFTFESNINALLQRAILPKIEVLNLTTLNTSGTEEATATHSGFVCLACPPGTFKNIPGNSSCMPCPAGAYSQTSQVCAVCPDYTTSPSNSPNQTSCTCNLGYVGPPGGPCNLPSCNPGEYNPDFDKSGPYTLSCKKCPLASWSNGGRSGLESCRCKSGFTGPNGGQCSACEKGKYKASDGPGPCSVCGQDEYTDEQVAATSCSPCPNNSNAFEGSVGLTSCSCNEGYKGPDCAFFMPQTIAKKDRCPTKNAFRKFEMEISLTIETFAEQALLDIKSQCVKEIAAYYGEPSNLPVQSESTATRRNPYGWKLKHQIEGNQEQFAASSQQQAGALTSFLKLRDLGNVRVTGIVVKCGAGFTWNSLNSACSPCAVGFYKNLLDNSACVSCPESVTTWDEGATNISACSEWAGQRLSRKMAEEAGYVLSAIVGSVVGINTLGTILGVVTSLLQTAGPESSTPLYSSSDSFAPSNLGSEISRRLQNGWGGGGSTMALITQVQILHVMARIGGSKGQQGLIYLSNSLGWVNFEFQSVSFFGTPRDRNMTVPVSPLAIAGAEGICSFDALVPTLDKLIWCTIIVVAVAGLRLVLCRVLERCHQSTTLPVYLRFPSWEGPVLLVEYIALCKSAFSALASGCVEWIVLGSVILALLPLTFLFVMSVLLTRSVQSEHIMYESCKKLTRTKPRCSSTLKSLSCVKGIVPNAMRMREWYLTSVARGHWKDGNEDAWRVKFFVGHYVHSAWFFGMWILSKKVLLLAATTMLDGRANAIMSIIVQTVDMLFTLGLRPYVSKVTCVAECTGAITNWLAFLNLGLLLWPGSLPLQLGEMSVFYVALAATCTATLAAGIEALMMAPVIIWSIGSFFSGCFFKTHSKIQELCLGTHKGTPASENGRNESVYLTSVAHDWLPRSNNTSQNLAPVLFDGVLHPSPFDTNAPHSHDPAVLASYYRQLADYHEMISLKMQTNQGVAMTSDSAMRSPVDHMDMSSPFLTSKSNQTSIKIFDPLGTRATSNGMHMVSDLASNTIDKQEIDHTSLNGLHETVAATVFSKRSGQTSKRPADLGSDARSSAAAASAAAAAVSAERSASRHVMGPGISRSMNLESEIAAPMSMVPPPLGVGKRDTDVGNSSVASATSPTLSLGPRQSSLPLKASPQSSGATGRTMESTISPRHSNNNLQARSTSSSPFKEVVKQTMPRYPPRVLDHRENDNGYSRTPRGSVSVSLPARSRLPLSPRGLSDRGSPRSLKSHDPSPTRPGEFLRQSLSTPTQPFSPSSASLASVSASTVSNTSPAKTRSSPTNLSVWSPNFRGNGIEPASQQSTVSVPKIPLTHLIDAGPYGGSRTKVVRETLTSSYGQQRQNLDDSSLVEIPSAPQYDAPPPPTSAPNYDAPPPPAPSSRHRMGRKRIDLSSSSEHEFETGHA